MLNNKQSDWQLRVQDAVWYALKTQDEGKSEWQASLNLPDLSLHPTMKSCAALKQMLPDWRLVREGRGQPRSPGISFSGCTHNLNTFKMHSTAKRVQQEV